MQKNKKERLCKTKTASEKNKKNKKKTQKASIQHSKDVLVL